MNCSQIFCTFAVETTERKIQESNPGLWIALKFFVLLQSKQHFDIFNLSRISCELLSNFLYFCSRNNNLILEDPYHMLWIALKFFVLLQSKQHLLIVSKLSIGCELLSNFLYFCSRNNLWGKMELKDRLWIALKFFVLLQSKQRT